MEEEDFVFSIDENLSSVQFNVVNTTSNAITLDLFNLATLSNIPTSPIYIYPPNSVQGNFGAFAPCKISAIASNGYLYVDDSSTNIYVFDTNNNNVLITIIPLFGILLGTSWITYNPINNRLYISDNTSNKLIIIDCATNTFLFSFGLPASPNQTSVNTSNNTLYIPTSLGIYVLNCVTNGIITTIGVTGRVPAYNSVNNLVYITDVLSNNLYIIDCATNTSLGFITLTLPSNMQYVASNNTLYVSNNSSTELGIVNCNTNTLLISIPIPLGIGTLNFSALNTSQNEIYWGTTLGYSVLISCSQNLIINSFFVALSSIATSVYSATQNSVYFVTTSLNTITQLTTIGVTTTSYYVSGSSNYNLFLQSLGYEPIKVDYVRVIANQTQLANNVSIYKIDSSGKSNQVPNFPILGVNAWQDQGNISLIKFKDLILDGRTYISQYVINANQTVILELFYSQFDLNNFRNILDSIMPIKVPLKGFFDDYTEL